MMIGQHKPVGREHHARAVPARPFVLIADRDMRDCRSDARDRVHDAGGIGIEVFGNFESRIEWHMAQFGIDPAAAGPGRISGAIAGHPADGSRRAQLRFCSHLLLMEKPDGQRFLEPFC